MLADAVVRGQRISYLSADILIDSIGKQARNIIDDIIQGNLLLLQKQGISNCMSWLMFVVSGSIDPTNDDICESNEEIISRYANVTCGDNSGYVYLGVS
jgi:hypothetical protein